MQKLIKSGKYELYPSLDAVTANLISLLLNPNSNQRPTINQVLKHQFFAKEKIGEREMKSLFELPSRSFPHQQFHTQTRQWRKKKRTSKDKNSSENQKTIKYSQRTVLKSLRREVRNSERSIEPLGQKPECQTSSERKELDKSKECISQV